MKHRKGDKPSADAGEETDLFLSILGDSRDLPAKVEPGRRCALPPAWQRVGNTLPVRGYFDNNDCISMQIPAPTIEHSNIRHRLTTSPAAVLCVVVTLLSILSGCTNVITPPPSPADPVTVYLLDHGRHPSLVLPQADGKLTRYVYGQWNWYALGHTGVFQALGAIFIPSQAALGRREFDSANLQPILRLDPADHVYVIQVERTDADRLRNELDATFQANISTLHVNEPYHLDFVHDPETYWYFHNSNRVVGNWLREMGCRVKGPGTVSSWRVTPAQGE